MEKLNIGVVFSKFENSQNWQLRVLEEIAEASKLELSVIIKVPKPEVINTGNISAFQRSRDSLSRRILKWQASFERKRYFRKVDQKRQFKDIDAIKNTRIIETHTFNSKNSNHSKEIYGLKNLNLDIIVLLEHGLNGIDLGHKSKFGIWTLIHSNYVNQNFFGFWEIVLKKPVVEVTLVKLGADENNFDVVDAAYFNRHVSSMVITNMLILESAVSLLTKNLKKLAVHGDVKIESRIYVDSNTEEPSLVEVFTYTFNFLKNLAYGFLMKLLEFFGYRNKRWMLFFGKGKFVDSELKSIQPLKINKDEFWADPFLFEYKNDIFIFFENYSYKFKKGNISCGKLNENETGLCNLIEILNLDYHLSYPYIFWENDEIYLMPETSQNNRLEIYKCIQFPNKWELFSVGFEGEKVLDAFFYSDKENQKWLFLNKIIAPYNDRTSELYIYRVDSVNLNTIEPHLQNPVLIDSRVARNGGPIFEVDSEIFRPSQRNTDGIYGKSLNINKIKCLTIENYKEETIREIDPNQIEKLKSIHHLHQEKDIFVYDGMIKKNFMKF